MSWASGTLGYLQYFPAKYVQVKTKKKVLSERGIPGTVPYVKSVPGYCIAFLKRLDEGLSYQLLGQKPLISLRLCVYIGWQTLN